ncbi:MAG: hypothetical protein HC915_03980 [Anaerolineae bacterium]|nr:hypothetical protein [Anaerolineae bacterium]
MFFYIALVLSAGMLVLGVLHLFMKDAAIHFQAAIRRQPMQRDREWDSMTSMGGFFAVLVGGLGLWWASGNL